MLMKKNEAQTLHITLWDKVIESELVLTYTLYSDRPVITRNAKIINHGSQTLYIERALSASIEFMDMDYEMVQLSGGWARERYVKTRNLEMGTQLIQSTAGTASSSEQNPFIALKRAHTTEHQGEVYGFSLVYSGNFLAQVEVSTFDMTRVMLGINPEGFSWELNPHTEFQTPEVVMVYSNQGLNKMSQVFHDLYRQRLMKGKWRDKERPILLNNWEATYFDFDEEKILDICRKAKESGVELFVLDDGWFGNRNDDRRGLGDWQVNLEKLPNGIAGLSRKVNELGLEFGLWVELEMINKDSDLYREHPDWLIGIDERFESHSRHQHVLDFTREDVVNYIYNMISKVIKESSISYIKWDMNRYMTEPYSRALAATKQGEVMHRYILGVYKLYTMLTNEFPDILFESCASGGARFDPAMLYFAPQTWTSDDTDGYERVKIQYGTSFVYPIVSMGSHVSAVPNHQLFRSTPLATRANVAYFGTFGYELDLNLLSDEEDLQVKKQIEFMKKYRRLIQIDGDFIRLVSPFEKNESGWMVIAKDKSEAIVGIYQSLNKVNGSWLRFRLKGLDEEAQYKILADEEEKLVYQAYGSELMNIGIPIDREELTQKGGDFASKLFVIKKL